MVWIAKKKKQKKTKHTGNYSISERQKNVLDRKYTRQINFAQIQYNILGANLYVSKHFFLYPQNINMETGVQAWEQQANHFSLEYRANSTWVSSVLNHKCSNIFPDFFPRSFSWQSPGPGLLDSEILILGQTGD